MNASAGEIHGYWSRMPKSQYFYIQSDEGKWYKSGGTRDYFRLHMDSIHPENLTTDNFRPLKIKHEQLALSNSIICDVFKKFIKQVKEVISAEEEIEENGTIRHYALISTTHFAYQDNHLSFFRLDSSDPGASANPLKLHLTFEPYLEINREHSALWENLDNAKEISEQAYLRMEKLWDSTLDELWDIIVRNCSCAVLEQEPESFDPYRLSDKDILKAIEKPAIVKVNSTTSSTELFINTIRELTDSEKDFYNGDGGGNADSLERYCIIKHNRRLLQIEYESRINSKDESEYSHTVDRNKALEMWNLCRESLEEFRSWALDRFNAEHLENVTSEQLKKGLYICTLDHQIPGHRRLQLCRISKIEKRAKEFCDIRGQIVYFNGDRLQIYKRSSMEVREWNSYIISEDLFNSTNALAEKILAEFNENADTK